MNNGAWPTEVGMARAYSAVGDYDKALEYCRIAHEQGPNKLNKDHLASAIEKLEKKEDIN
jgi:tetratricopeptide (TPR) repeat protein